MSSADVSGTDVSDAVRLRVLGADVLVRCDEPTARMLRHLFAPFVQVADAPTTGRPATLTAPVLDGTTPLGSADGPTPGLAGGSVGGSAAGSASSLAGGSVGTLAAEVNALALADAGCLAVHAGAVAVGGSVVAFPAASGAGKTTLTAACLLAGLAYVSDEALCLDWHDGTITAYPRPLALSPWSMAALGLADPTVPIGIADPVAGETLVSPADLGAEIAAVPLRLAHLVLLDEPGGAPGLRPESRSAGVAELLRRSFTHWHRPERAFELAHEVLADASVWRLSPSTPAHDAAALATLLAGTTTA